MILVLMIDCTMLKRGSSDLGTKILQKISSLYSQSLLIFIHRTPVVERHSITRQIRFTMAQRETRSIFT